MKTIDQLIKETQMLAIEHGVDPNDIIISDGANDWRLDNLIDESISSFDERNYGENINSFGDYLSNYKTGYVRYSDDKPCVFK